MGGELGSKSLSLTKMHAGERGFRRVKEIAEFWEERGVRLNLPQFDGHFEKGYTNLKGVSHEKEEGI